ncbi:MAG TPA: YraN family protein [Candidatus Polarisedimenticolia bacterium]|nr:YraN family protein [Candidatus Polarisedimenticolia bacterium]
MAPRPTASGADPRKILGDRGEQTAADFLARSGMRIVERKFRCKGGEVDLIAKDGDDLVFVEVKTRSSLEFGEGSEAVTAAKRRRILRAAALYLSARDSWSHPCRFDVVSVRFSPTGATLLEHLKDAFAADR